MTDLLRSTLPEPQPVLAERLRSGFLVDAALGALAAGRRDRRAAGKAIARWFRQERRLGAKDRPNRRGGDLRRNPLRAPPGARRRPERSRSRGRRAPALRRRSPRGARTRVAGRGLRDRAQPRLRDRARVVGRPRRGGRSGARQGALPPSPHDRPGQPIALHPRCARDASRGGRGGVEPVRRSSRRPGDRNAGEPRRARELSRRLVRGPGRVEPAARRGDRIRRPGQR